MIANELTNRARIAMLHAMQGNRSGKRRSGWRGKPALAVLLGGAVALSACVSVNAPDKPIVIELNINIKQEVVYRLAADAEKTIDENSGAF
jgi:YnbE-like lipoprotein